MFVNDSDTYADRPNMDYFNKLSRGGNYGIGQSSGPMWVEQRRTTLKVLRDFGMGKNLIQDRVGIFVARNFEIFF